MKYRPKKWILFSALFVLIAIALYASTMSFGAVGKGNTPNAEAMLEEVQNGQSKLVDSIPIEQGTVGWIHKKQSELAALIAEQTELDSDDVLVVLGPLSEVDDTSSYHLACSVVLKTESTFEDNLINNVVEDIITAVTEDDSVDAKISTEDITIVNSNNAKLN